MCTCNTVDWRNIMFRLTGVMLLLVSAFSIVIWVGNNLIKRICKDDVTDIY